MQIITLEPPFLAEVEAQGVRRKVSTVLVSHEKIQVGDWLLIHTGCAIGKINEKEAQETLKLLEQVECV